MLKHCRSSSSRRRPSLDRDVVVDGTELDVSLASLDTSSSSSEEASTVLSSRRSSYSTSTALAATALAASSRASSVVSLMTLTDVGGPKTVLRVFCRCLRPDVEYKTLSVGNHVTSAEVVRSLLDKFRMRHRDPNLFYLTLDMGNQSEASMTLEDDARPAELQSCHPYGKGCRFTLRARRGALVRVHDNGALTRESRYKSLLVAERTTAADVVALLLRCHHLDVESSPSNLFIVERCVESGFERRLHPLDRPAEVQGLWPAHAQRQFVLRRHNDEEVDAEPMDVSSSSSSTSSWEEDSPKRVLPNFNLRGPVSAMNKSELDALLSRPHLRHRFLLQQNVFQQQQQHQYLSMTPIREASEDYSVYASLQQQQHSKTATSSAMQHPKTAMSTLSSTLQYHPKTTMSTLSSTLQYHPKTAVPAAASIHQSGLPPPPPPKPALCLNRIHDNTNNKRASLGSTTSSSSSNVSFHEYENYFYI